MTISITTIGSHWLIKGAFDCPGETLFFRWYEQVKFHSPDENCIKSPTPPPRRHPSHFPPVPAAPTIAAGQSSHHRPTLQSLLLHRSIVRNRLFGALVRFSPAGKRVAVGVRARAPTVSLNSRFTIATDACDGHSGIVLYVLSIEKEHGQTSTKKLYFGGDLRLGEASERNGRRMGRAVLSITSSLMFGGTDRIFEACGTCIFGSNADKVQ
ncbi:uncharacterized protein LOC116254768 [Nymphaea colorata]|nr:uncharacterized protein LOC116254768 [Nymphaea colorata]